MSSDILYRQFSNMVTWREKDNVQLRFHLTAVLLSVSLTLTSTCVWAACPVCAYIDVYVHILCSLVNMPDKCQIVYIATDLAQPLCMSHFVCTTR